MSTDLIRIAREIGQLSVLFPAIAEKEELLRLEREHAEALAALAHSPQPPPQDATAPPPPEPAQSGNPTTGVWVKLPHLNKALEMLFKIMWDNWHDAAPRHRPKQGIIAGEIDAAMNWRTQADGTPSRNAITLARLIRPDEV